MTSRSPVALDSRKDLNDPHAAALWDSRSPVALDSREDLNDPHAAALWDLTTIRYNVQNAKHQGLNLTTS